MIQPESEDELAAVCRTLGASSVAGWSRAEESLGRDVTPRVRGLALAALKSVRNGADPLGEAFCALRTPLDRRAKGATYTPSAIVSAMVDWSRKSVAPARVVDPGVGSARFLVAAGRAFPRARLVGIEVDPLAAMLARAHLAAAGLAGRSEVRLGDYRETRLPDAGGRTLFLGNPPYVRHHLIEAGWKAWLTKTAAKYGKDASQLAGLHVHFFLATLEHAKAGDYCVFVTAAEWLDVNYGRLVRELFLDGLGGKSVHLIEPAAQPFPDAATTAVITCCEVREKPTTIRLRRVCDPSTLGDLGGGRLVRRERLEAARRWGPFLRPSRAVPEGSVELGELCRVHRGQVTGANRVWIEGDHSRELPESVLFPTVTKARELIRAGETLSDPSSLRRVIDLPVDLDVLSGSERSRVEKFLKVAKSMGADQGFIATHRRAWWSVRLRDPAPILTTYMARRAPAVVRNLAGARHINIAHGIYPREPLSERALSNLVRHLSTTVTVTSGRTYAGGLTKFEPQEVERLLVPDLAALERGV